MGLDAVLPSSFWTVAISITVSGFFMGPLLLIVLTCIAYPIMLSLSVRQFLSL